MEDVRVEEISLLVTDNRKTIRKRQIVLAALLNIYYERKGDVTENYKKIVNIGKTVNNA